MSKKIIYYHLPFWLWTIALYTGTSLPGSSITLPDFQFSDKVAHFVAYAGVGFLLRRLVPYLRAEFWKKSYTNISLIIGVFMGIFDELHQIFIPGRDASFGDLLADIIGVVLGILIYYFAKKVLPSIA